MTTQAATRLSAEDIARLDPYAFMSVLGKKVIHPGGRRSTEALYRFAEFKSGQHILDVGAGVGATAIEIANRFGFQVTAVDIDPLMLTRAEANVQAAKAQDRVTVPKADIQALQFPDNSFDAVVIEAVTMFVNRPRAVSEVVRVCSPNGRILDHEFIYRKPPTAEVRRIFEGEVCPGIKFDTAEDWIELYRAGDVMNIQSVSGPFVMMTPMGMLRDEGIGNLIMMMVRTMSSWSTLRKMSWLMSRLLRVMAYLGYVVLVGTKVAE